MLIADEVVKVAAGIALSCPLPVHDALSHQIKDPMIPCQHFLPLQFRCSKSQQLDLGSGVQISICGERQAPPELI